MSGKYIDILKNYLKKNNRKAIGYSDEEIIKIEKLYDIEIKGDFKEFIKFAGRTGGGLLGDDPIILYRRLWNIRSYLGINCFNFINDDFPVLRSELGKKPFVFSIEMENYYFYIRTIDDDLRVYCYDENEEVIRDTGMDFNEYMIDLVKRYNIELNPINEKSSIGELLIQCDLKERRITDLKKIKEYTLLGEEEETELLKILREYLELNNKEYIGYNDDEIKGIEELYNLEIKGDFRDFLKLIGKNSGGLLGEDELVLYKEWSVRERLLSKFIFTKYLGEDEFYEEADGKPFIIRLEDETNYFFIVTRNKDMKVYHYNREKRELKETGMGFTEYIVYLIRKYNPELRELKDVSISGDIINI